MKKVILLAGAATLFSIFAYAKEAQGVECPSGCHGGNIKCCVTSGASTYFTR